jgi:hypothetical protein
VDAHAERVARNESTFREANERIQRAAETHAFAGLVPFICECADERCTEIIRLRLAAYEAVRASATRFVVAPGHEEGESSRLVSDGEGYQVIEKTGDAASVAEALHSRNPRE